MGYAVYRIHINYKFLNISFGTPFTAIVYEELYIHLSEHFIQ